MKHSRGLVVGLQGLVCRVQKQVVITISLSVFFFLAKSPAKKGTRIGYQGLEGKSCLSATMYLSAFITQAFLSLLLFQVQQASEAKDDSSLMRLQAQKRTSFLSDDHLTPEEISNGELTTLASGDILIDKSGSGPEQRNQQPWHQQDPVGFLVTDCTTTGTTGTTDHFDQSSLLPSAKFQRRQTQIPNACYSQWNTQQEQGQMKLQQGEQGQEGEQGQTTPGVTRPGEGQIGEEAKPGWSVPTPRMKPYPTDSELFTLFHYGRKGNSNEICDELVEQGIPICAPYSVPPQLSPAKVVAPSRFCKCVFVFVEFWLCHAG